MVWMALRPYKVKNFISKTPFMFKITYDAFVFKGLSISIPGILL